MQRWVNRMANPKPQSPNPKAQGPDCRCLIRAVVVGIWVLGFGISPSAQRGGAPATARAGAVVDLTGVWVSVVTEDWRWRMRTPPPKDYASLPLTPSAVKIADAWNPATDIAAGEQCRGYGAAAVMRLPGRVRISWESDVTLKVETEAGTQTRRFIFGRPQAPAQKDYQGMSAAQWQIVGGGRRGGGPPRGGSLRVVTTGMRAGYLQKNGVPYSENAVVTEYFNTTKEPNGDEWLIVTTEVVDPTYLNTRHVRRTHFKKVSDTPWTPTACSAS